MIGLDLDGQSQIWANERAAKARRFSWSEQQSEPEGRSPTEALGEKLMAKIKLECGKGVRSE